MRPFSSALSILWLSAPGVVLVISVMLAPFQGHFALDTAADQIAQLVRGFAK